MRKNLKMLAFYFCYSITLIDITFRYTYGLGDFLHMLLNYIALPILCLVIIDNLKGLSIKRIIAVLSIVAVGFLTRIVSNDNAIMMIALFICAFREMEFESLIKVTLPIRIISLVFLFIFFSLGLTKNSVYIRSDGVERYAYGFGNLNNLSTYILTIVMSVVYLDRKRIRIRDYLVVILGLLSILIITFSRTHMLMLIALLAVMIYSSLKTKSRKIKIKSKIAKLITINSFILMAIVSILVYVGYINGNNTAKKIDIETSGRVTTVYYLVEKHGISWFGQRIDRTTSDGGRRPLDNSYAYILLYFGPIVLICMALLYRKTTKDLYRKNNDAGALFASMFSVAGLMEHFSIEATMNMYLLLVSDYVYGNNNAKNKKTITDIGNSGGGNE